MAGPLYCEREDVYRQGVPRGTLSLPARLIASVDTAADTFALDGHGLADDDALQVQAEEGGSLPAELTAGTVYYALVVSDSLFQLRASPGGSAIDISTAGSRLTLVYAGESGRMIDEAIEYASRLVDGALTAHRVPLAAPYPAWIVKIVAVIAGQQVLAVLGRSNDRLESMALQAREDLRTMAKGVPLRDAEATPQVAFARGISRAGSRRSGGEVP